MIFVNFKSSVRATGANAEKLVKELALAQKETRVPIIPVPHDLDIWMCREFWDGEIWAQHADFNGGTGKSPVETLKEWHPTSLKLRGASGISGVFLNHSEHKYDGYTLLSKVINQCNEYELKTLVFASSIDEIDKILEPKIIPTYIAYEPPELIGSPDTSVAKSKPKSIKEAADRLKSQGIPLIVGAGIKDKEDAVSCVEYGAVGIALSSAIIHAEDIKAKVLELAEGFK
ncbi:MAG: triosephosphate isomerase (TIM) [Microgenomates group bacterium Gr01-1014_5]|nr:MAG: triosephosphate isomerase (TIM) [Microgenomates group bacterium Gr01-1014_5]